MRKFFHILLISLILLVTSGVKVDAHWCHNNLTEIHLGDRDSNCCDDSCTECFDEIIVIELDADLVYAAQNSVQFNIFLYPELAVINTLLEFKEAHPKELVIRFSGNTYPSKTRLAKLQRYLC